MDVLCAGELLVDMASVATADSLAAATAFTPLPGGSPANLAANLTQLGKRAGLVAAVGADSLGASLLAHVRGLGLDGSLVARVDGAVSTVVLVTQTTGTPDFELYRGADARIAWPQLARGLEAGPRVFHTTCFSLSGLPARSHLLRAAAAFAKTGGTLSLDANYAAKVWPDRGGARRVVAQYVRRGALVKVSEDDWLRLYGETLTPDNCDTLAQRLLEAGARLVCCTFGARGAAAVTADGVAFAAAEPTTVADATGAGDAYWAGFLAAYLDDLTPENCLRAGAAVAAVKLRRRGPLVEPLDYRGLL